MEKTRRREGLNKMDMCQRGYGEMHKELIEFVMVDILLYIGNFWMTSEEIHDDIAGEYKHIKEALDELVSRNLIIHGGNGYELPDEVYEEIEHIKRCAILDSKLFRGIKEEED